LALLSADSPNRLELLLDVVDSKIDFAAICFELRFTRPTRSDTAAKLTHSFAASSQPRKLILKLCKLDLELAFSRSGVAGEDIED